MTDTTNTPLIAVSQIEIAGATVAGVDARELHSFLRIRKDFTDWVKAQIKRARLVENRDFSMISADQEVYPQKGVNPLGGRPSADYWLTLDAAKHVAMMAGTERGFEVREYFIECERRLNGQSLPPPAEPLSPNTEVAAWLSLSLKERRQRLGEVKIYAQIVNHAAARCYAWDVGFPIPDRRFLGAAHQMELDMTGRGRAGGGSSVTINVISDVAGRA